MDRDAAPPTLDDLLDQIWAGLARAVRDRHSNWRTPGLATIGTDGAPELRTVVLRGADRAGASLRLFTDARSAKAAQIAREPRVALLFWDPRAQAQLRATGTAQIAGDPKAFAALPEAARALYAAAPPPGSPIEAPDAFATESDAAHFAVLKIRLAAFEHLVLATPHRRARFDLSRGTATWLVP